MSNVVVRLAALTLAAGGIVATAGPASAHEVQSGPANSTVWVHGDGSHVTLSRNSVDGGRVTFKVDTSNAKDGSDILLFRLVGNATLGRFKADLAEEFSEQPSTAAKGTRDLTRDARFFGLAQVGMGTPATVTEQLSEGTYYLMDGGSGPSPAGPAFTKLTVSDTDGQQGPATRSPLIAMTSSDRFVSPSTLPAQGTVTVSNVSDTIHFMTMQPVKKGTTDADIDKFGQSGAQGPPPFALEGPSVGLNVLSPGKQANLSYKLPAGTYVLLCFIADDKTGMPHVAMGMHKVVTLSNASMGTAAAVAATPASGAPHTGGAGAVNPLNGLIALALLGASGTLVVMRRSLRWAGAHRA